MAPMRIRAHLCEIKGQLCVLGAEGVGCVQVRAGACRCVQVCAGVCVQVCGAFSDGWERKSERADQRHTRIGFLSLRSRDGDESD